MKRCTSLLTLLIVVGCSSARQQKSFAEWEQFDFTRERVDSSSVASLPLADLRRLRGLIFGRHGRVFAEDKDIAEYLRSRPWYKPDTAFRNSRLTDVERANLDVIRDAESYKHTEIETGDMRSYRHRVITTAMLGHHKAGDWDVLLAEVEAVHGKRFDYGEPDEQSEDGRDIYYMQEYFNDRYWYTPRDDYKPAALTPIEVANLDTIRLAQMRDLGYGVMPGTMYLFRTTPLTDSLIKGQSLYELRILRNEVYALHGRRFQTPWLRSYFSNQSWYHPREDFSDAELSETEKSNVKLIVVTEARRHEELSIKELDGSELEGLFPEIARRLRNEIFARHGRKFRDPTLQSYFASLDWYHPASHFDESSLSPIEKANVQTIFAYEQQAKTGVRFTPG